MLRHATVLLLFCACSLGFAQAPSDAKLKGPTLQRFMKTKGASHAGRPVLLKIPSSVFQGRPNVRGRYWSFPYRGMELLVLPGDRDLQVIRRRGGKAQVRGRVVRLLGGKKKANKTPQHKFGILVREMRFQRK